MIPSLVPTTPTEALLYLNAAVTAFVLWYLRRFVSEHDEIKKSQAELRQWKEDAEKHCNDRHRQTEVLEARLHDHIANHRHSYPR